MRVKALAAVAVLGGGLWLWTGSRSRAPTPAGPAVNALVAARPYGFRAPAKPNPQISYPLVIVLHGLGGKGEAIARYYQLDRLVDELGFLVAYPEGSEEARRTSFWTPRRKFWNATNGCCDFLSSGVDDVAYLDAVIDDVGAHYRVDPKRIFVVGLSNGGYMAHRYACDRAGRVAAIVSQAGAMWSDPSRCQPSEPVAVLQIHGTDDSTVPYRGQAPPQSGGSGVPSAHETVADWVGFDKCAPAPDTSSPALDLLPDDVSLGFHEAETTVEKWTGCRGVELWTMRDAGHRPHLNQPAWARAVYGWLAAHPKP